MKPITYANPPAFKAALEARLRNQSAHGVDFARRRQLLVFERLLARLAEEFGASFMLKGGLVLELRLDRARTTKDVDLRVEGPPDEVLSRLQRAGQRELGDFLAYEVVVDAHHPTIENDGLVYEGRRFRAECRLAGKPYGSPFSIDVVFGEPYFGAVETLVTHDTLSFAGVAPPSVRVYPLETHIAEKLHAYTMPRERPNSRVKDLPDLALLAGIRDLDADAVRGALRTAWGFRRTHAVPKRLPDPAEAWRRPYEAMAAANALPWTTLEEVTAAARAFLDPVLADDAPRRWSAPHRAWTPAPP